MANKLYDILIIGGGPAGLAVATGLVRQLHTALVIDSGVYRNARTRHMHNVAGYDHVDPAEFRAKARADLVRRYDTVQFQSATISEIKKLDNGQFSARDQEGNTYQGRKVVLASGIKDVMPDIEGYGDCWARGIFHCLFCHGFEERGGDSAGVLAIDMLSNPAMAIHVGNMALQLAKNITIYTNGSESTAASITEAMKPASSRIAFETRKIKNLTMASPGTESAEVIVTLEDDTQKKESFITHAPLAELNGPFIAQLGIELGQAGEVKVNPPFNETSVRGVFAAGDVATPMRAVPMAMSMGAFVAAGVAAQLQAEKRLEEQ